MVNKVKIIKKRTKVGIKRFQALSKDQRQRLCTVYWRAFGISRISVSMIPFLRLRQVRLALRVWDYFVGIDPMVVPIWQKLGLGKFPQDKYCGKIVMSPYVRQRKKI